MILMAIAMVSMSNRALAMVRMLLNPIETMVSNEHDANGNGNGEHEHADNGNGCS